VEKRIRNREETSAEAKKLARERVLVILQVRSGMLSAREGAQRLRVSRKTYYEWEERALEAMASALENHPVGRRAVPMDEEKENLRRQIRELEKKLDLAEKTIEVKELLAAYDSFKDVGSKKNKTKRRQTGRKR
jgi:transposase